MIYVSAGPGFKGFRGSVPAQPRIYARTPFFTYSLHLKIKPLKPLEPLYMQVRGMITDLEEPLREPLNPYKINDHAPGIHAFPIQSLFRPATIENR